MYDGVRKIKLTSFRVIQKYEFLFSVIILSLYRLMSGTIYATIRKTEYNATRLSLKIEFKLGIK